jgi:hypothetical protein
MEESAVVAMTVEERTPWKNLRCEEIRKTVTIVRLTHVPTGITAEGPTVFDARVNLARILDRGTTLPAHPGAS